MKEINTEKMPIRMWLNEIEDGAMEQILLSSYYMNHTRVANSRGKKNATCVSLHYDSSP